MTELQKRYPKEFVDFYLQIEARNPLYVKLKRLPQYFEWFRETFNRPWRLLKDHVMPLAEFFPLQGSVVLDNGCGTGSSTVALCLQSATVIGLEMQKESVKVAKLRAKYHKVNPEFVVGDARLIPFRDNVFDLCVCISVLEHIDEGRERCLKESLRVTRKHGVFAISGTPNRISPKDYHTTRLWFVPYMPKKLAHRYALFRGRIISEMSLERGITYWEIIRPLSENRIRVINRGDVEPLAEMLVSRLHLPNCMRVISANVIAQFVKKLCDVMRIPTNAIMPSLTLYIEKC